MSKLVQKIDPINGTQYVGRVQREELAEGLADAHYVHEQMVPSSVWTIQHNLGKKPSVVVVDSANSVVYGEIEYVDLNTIRLIFSGAFSGKAILN